MVSSPSSGVVVVTEDSVSSGTTVFGSAKTGAESAKAPNSTVRAIIIDLFRRFAIMF